MATLCILMATRAPLSHSLSHTPFLGHCVGTAYFVQGADPTKVCYACGARAHRQSCRKLHAVFAAENAHHCAHLSFKPMADPEGKVKCQESAQIPVSDLFSDDELAMFADFVVKLGFEPDQYVRSSPCKTQANCPVAGDVEEHPRMVTGNYYTNNATCVFGAPTERRLLFGATPQTGVCVPT